MADHCQTCTAYLKSRREHYDRLCHRCSYDEVRSQMTPTQNRIHDLEAEVERLQLLVKDQK